MTIHTCKYVHASGLFKGLTNLWNEFADSDPPFSWGDNNRSLVDPASILNHMDGSGVIENQRQVETLRKRVEKLPAGVYVDLEN
jgi:hypothetical protein